MNTLRYCLAVALLAALGTSFALAGGYQLNEHGTKAMGMAGAFAAQASDGSAIYFNPAGLGFQQGIKALVGVTPIFTNNRYISPGGVVTKMKKQTFLLPHGFGSYGLDNGLTFGIGVFAPYGLGTDWPTDWSGRYLAVKADLKSIYINPAIAYKINDKVSIGAGFSYVWSNVKLNRKIALALPTRPPTLLPDGNIALDGSGHGFDFSVGLLTMPAPELSIGVSYRHSVKVEYQGTATFTNMTSLASLFPGGTGKTTLTFPNNVFVGVCVRPIDRLTVEADLQYVEWLKYDTLKIDIPVGPTAPAPLNRPLQGPSASPKNWDNTFILRFGAQYEFDEFAVRAGYIFDKSPQPSAVLEPMLPDADRDELTAGFGYQITKEISIDIAYQYIIFKNRQALAPENTFPGTYKAKAHLVGLSIGYAM